MRELLKTFVILIAIDFVYLGLLQKDKMARYFKNVNCGKEMVLRWAPAILSWMLLAAALRFVVFPYAKTKKEAIIRAFQLGLIVYGVYDMTNLATIASWTLGFSLLDMVWGGTLFALVTYLMY